MEKLFDKHIALVEEVNNSTSEDQHSFALQKLRGFRDALDIIGVNHLCACDQFYLDKGINRPMCCGVWLDWTPA